MRSVLASFSQLSKFKISFFSSLTCSVGYVLATRSLSFEILIATSGVLFLACGSAALNHFQERALDAKMARTNRRPIPSGDITEVQALVFIIGCLLLGMAILYFGANATALLLGVLALVWYNGIYTYL